MKDGCKWRFHCTKCIKYMDQRVQKCCFCAMLFVSPHNILFCTTDLLSQMTELIVNVLINSLHPTKIAANWRQLVYFTVCLKSNMTVYSGNWRAELGSKKNLGGAKTLPKGKCQKLIMSTALDSLCIKRLLFLNQKKKEKLNITNKFILEYYQ